MILREVQSMPPGGVPAVSWQIVRRPNDSTIDYIYGSTLMSIYAGDTEVDEMRQEVQKACDNWEVVVKLDTVWPLWTQHKIVNKQ